MEDSGRSRLTRFTKKDPELSFSFLGLLFLAVLMGFIRNPFYLDLLIMIFLWAMLASSWNIAGGYAGMFSLGHGAFIGIGAYMSSMLFIHFKLSPWIGMIVGAVAAGIVASFPRDISAGGSGATTLRWPPSPSSNWSISAGSS